jgi:hypothetical protein
VILPSGMEYDTAMSARSPVKLRSPPDGGSFDAWEAGWEGNVIQLTISDGSTGFSPGVPAEIESESMLYLGVVRQHSGSTMKVLVEHSLERARLASLQNTWR